MAVQGRSGRIGSGRWSEARRAKGRVVDCAPGPPCRRADHHPVKRHRGLRARSLGKATMSSKCGLRCCPRPASSGPEVRALRQTGCQPLARFGYQMTFSRSPPPCGPDCAAGRHRSPCGCSRWRRQNRRSAPSGSGFPTSPDDHLTPGGGDPGCEHLGRNYRPVWRIHGDDPQAMTRALKPL